MPTAKQELTYGDAWSFLGMHRWLAEMITDKTRREADAFARIETLLTQFGGRLLQGISDAAADVISTNGRPANAQALTESGEIKEALIRTLTSHRNTVNAQSLTEQAVTRVKVRLMQDKEGRKVLAPEEGRDAERHIRAAVEKMLGEPLPGAQAQEALASMRSLHAGLRSAGRGRGNHQKDEMGSYRLACREADRIMHEVDSASGWAFKAGYRLAEKLHTAQR